MISERREARLLSATNKLNKSTAMRFGSSTGSEKAIRETKRVKVLSVSAQMVREAGNNDIH